MKKWLPLLLTAALLFSVLPFAASAAQSQYTSSAYDLYYRDLFRGTGETADGPTFELNRTATRAESLVMLIRLLGEEQLTDTGYDLPNPFSDVTESDWFYPYVTFAYAQGYTKGTSANTFSPNASCGAEMYTTFLLRALGYSESAGDFTYTGCLTKAGQLGITKNWSKDATFYRDDIVYLSNNTLSQKFKNSTETLGERLTDDGAMRVVKTFSPGQEAAILAAIQNAPSRLCIVLKAGTYSFDSLGGLKSAGNSVCYDLAIIGDGSVSILSKNEKDTIVDLSGIDNVTLEGLTLGHDPSLSGQCTTGVVALQDVSGACTICRCDIFGCGMLGVSLKNCSWGDLLYTTIRDCEDLALELYQSGVSAEHCTFTGNGYGAFRDSQALIMGYFESVVSLMDCTITNNQNYALFESVPYSENEEYPSTCEYEDCIMTGNAWD